MDLNENNNLAQGFELTDRALLELAAKAAGMAVLPEGRWPRDAKGWFFNQVGDHPPALYSNYAPGAWAPLTDDGDAFRLAVKLRLCLFLEIPRIGIGPMLDGPEIYLEEGDDPYAATRRAVVRAAAQIGAAHE